MKMDRPDSGPSRSSILGLDALTFLMADVRDGVGPYLSIYLKGALHWQSGEIGIAMAVSSITAAICQIPAGLLVDAVRAKRLLVVISGIMVGIGSLLVVCLPKLAVIARTHHLAGFRRVISSWQCAMLPMAGQVLAKKHPGADIIALSGCIIAAQLVMIGVAATVGWALRRGVGRKAIFLVAFVTLPVRGILFTLTDSPLGVVAIQLLDGVAAGIFGVISIIIAADLMRGTGRFNLAQGLVALSTGLGAGGSNVFAGFVVQVFGYTTGFLSLAAIAVGGLAFFASFMPETEPEKEIGSTPAQGDTPIPNPV